VPVKKSVTASKKPAKSAVKVPAKNQAKSSAPIGIPAPAETPAPGPIVHVKCKRGSDHITRNQSCFSMQAYKLTRDGASVVQFRCTKCSYVWSVSVGGVIDI
jgi:hypothetical protein